MALAKEKISFEEYQNDINSIDNLLEQSNLNLLEFDLTHQLFYQYLNQFEVLIMKYGLNNISDLIKYVQLINYKDSFLNYPD